MVKPVPLISIIRNFSFRWDELVRAISQALRQPEVGRESRQKLVDQEITVNRGTAGQAVARWIELQTPGSAG